MKYVVNYYLDRYTDSKKMFNIFFKLIGISQTTKVYCLTMPSLGMGRIFTIGSTAAMAWMLPHEPMVFLDKKKGTDEIPSRLPHQEDIPDFYYEKDYGPNINSSVHLPEDHETIDKQKYYNFGSYQRVGRPHVFSKPAYQTFGQHIMEQDHWHIYRRTRRSLYGKLEKVLSALSKDGQSCILKMICEVSHIADRKGSFMEEIFKVIFRIKPHNMNNEDMYDTAANKSHNCNERYKSCPESFFGKF
ncbi:uncharacterized protein LOC123674922 isoform X2 [Harmonia axyridis]|uniref:uncharacterized protein LOC123674922 isoform X2 n=1 Tax=Harmonia axyridis TaxID=115357 RepID=UPI001E278E65|nr:uncharacterized protein LOC123674922 isoform X2 [Harmonia axyridis]